MAGGVLLFCPLLRFPTVLGPCRTPEHSILLSKMPKRLSLIYLYMFFKKITSI